MDSPAPDTAFRSTRQHTRGRGAFMRALGYFSSMKSAAATIALLAAVLGIATVYERDYGREAAAVMVYQSWWFKLIFAALAVNIFGAAAVRYPWRRHQTGFVVVHVGLLTLMLGFTLSGGRLDGMLSVNDKEAASRIQLPHDYLGVVVGAKQYAVQFQPLHWAGYPSFARFCASPLASFAFPGLRECDQPLMTHAEGSPFTRRLRQLLGDESAIVPNDIPEIRAVGVVDTARFEPGFVANAGGAPAVKVDLKGRFPGMPMGMLVPVQSGWMSMPDQTDLSAGPATVTLARSANAELLRDFIVKPTDELALPQLRTYWRGETYVIDIDAKALPVTHDIADDLRIIIERAIDRPKRTDTSIEEDPEAAFEPFLAVHVGVGADPQRKWETVPVFAFYPCYGITPGQPEFLYEHPGMYKPATDEKGVNLQLIAGPDRCLYARALSRSKGWLSAMRVESNWQGTLIGGIGSPMQVDAALNFLPEAAPGPEAVHVVPDTKDEHSERWLQFEVGGERVWLKRGERKEVNVAGTSVFLHYARAEHDLSKENGFSVQLEKFEEGKDPGGQSSASYASDVTVIDAGGQRASRHITMNEPLTVNGVTLYQSSFIPEHDDQGQPTGKYLASVFTVATDPGLWFKYAGSFILVFGIILMYVMRR